jgi:uncharacterized protein (TIGR02099 family)
VTPRASKLVTWLLWITGGICLLIALTFAGFGYIVSRVPEYRVQLQDWINERSGLAVEFSTLSARLRLYGPELVFTDAVVRTPDRTRVLAVAKRGSVGFDLWGSIGSGRLTAGRFALDAPELGLIRTREGRIQLLGQSALPEREAKPFALEQLPTGRFRVVDAVVSFRDEITGRGPWSLSGVSFDLERSTKSMRLRGNASLPRALGRELRFSATVEGDIEDAASLVSTFSVNGAELDLAGWADVLPDALPAPETGRGSLQVSGAFRGPSLIQLAADVDFVSIAAALPTATIPLPTADGLPQVTDDEVEPAEEVAEKVSEATAAPEAPRAAAPEMLSYSRVAFGLRAQRVDNVWNASVTNLQLARPESTWRAGRIEARWSGDPKTAMNASGTADRIVLDMVWPLLGYLPESQNVARVRALAASGAIENLTFDFRRDAPESLPKYSVEAELKSVAVKPVERAPGFGGLNCALRANEAGGECKLTATDASFELPRMFREALVAQSVEGTVRWRRADPGWTISSDEVRVGSVDGTGVARFEARIAGDGSSPMLDLSARGENLKVEATSKYIPAGKLGPRTMEWFDRAFIAGRVTNAELTYQGTTRDFPFRKGEGTFLVRGHVEDAVFDYQPGWTPARDVTADLEFRNQGMQIRATEGTIGGLRVTNAVAEIPDLKETRLSIKAGASGDLREGLQLLQQSPLAASLGQPFARLAGHGALSTEVQLYLPIKNMANRRIQVATKLKDASLSMQNIDAPIHFLNGSLTVRNTLVTAADLKGQWLGGPLQLSVRSDAEASPLLQANGRATAAQLQKVLSLPSQIKVTGETDWSLSSTLAGASSVRIESNLQGLGIGLPEPIGKSEFETLPLQLTLEQEGKDAVLARGALGAVRALVRVKRDGESWGLDRGGIRADATAPALPNHRGLRIDGSVERFALEEWLELRDENSTGGKPLSEYLHAANVRVGTFELGGYRWSDLRGIMQSTQAGWRVDVSGAGAAGQVIIPENFRGTQPLRATLERLVLEKKEQAEAQAGNERDPREIPNLEVYVGELRVGQRAIGSVDLKATRAPQGIRFERATIIGASVRAEGRGEWLVTPEGPRSSLQATVTSSDMAATLRDLNYTAFIDGKLGELRGDLTWRGGFEGNILERANGTISARAEAGQLVALQPGAGRVLGLFSLAALPRRLALDFSDLTEKGLAFDSVHGDFELRDGNAYTRNLLLRGPAAEIGIAGRTGLASRDYDQTAVVTGNLGASLPVAGALAGGPAVGAALLLFSQVFKEPLKGMTRGYYRITGSWDDPVVERVDAAAVKISEQKGSAGTP